MTLKEYIKNLQAVEKKYPDLEVVYSIDDEGNGFSRAHHTPCIGDYQDGEFIAYENTEEFKENFKINAVCIN
jgi:hypothetical protein